MSKTVTNLRLSPITVGYLHYLVQEGETKTNYEIIDLLVANYMEFLAEEKDLDMDEINKEAMILYNSKRRPQSNRSRKEQEIQVKKAMDRLNTVNKPTKSKLNEPIFSDDVEWGDGQ